MIVHASQRVQGSSWLPRRRGPSRVVAAAEGAGRSVEVLCAALRAVPFSEWLGGSLCHDAATPAFAAAQAFHIRGDWRVGLEAEMAKNVSGQACFMPAVQATDKHNVRRYTQRGHRS